jgi:hypothetical protein
MVWLAAVGLVGHRCRRSSGRPFCEPAGPEGAAQGRSREDSGRSHIEPVMGMDLRSFGNLAENRPCIASGRESYRFHGLRSAAKGCDQVNMPLGNWSLPARLGNEGHADCPYLPHASPRAYKLGCG